MYTLPNGCYFVIYKGVMVYKNLTKGACHLKLGIKLKLSGDVKIVNLNILILILQIHKCVYLSPKNVPKKFWVKGDPSKAPKTNQV